MITTLSLGLERHAKISPFLDGTRLNLGKSVIFEEANFKRTPEIEVFLVSAKCVDA